MKKFLSLLIFLTLTANSIFAATYGCKTYYIKNKKTFMTTYKQKNGFYNRNANVGYYIDQSGKRAGTIKKKGKRIVAYDYKGHRMSYCQKNSSGRIVLYNRSGIPSGYCD